MFEIFKKKIIIEQNEFEESYIDRTLLSRVTNFMPLFNCNFRE